MTGDTVAKNDDVDFIAASVCTETDRNTYQPMLAEGDEKARIEAKYKRPPRAASRLSADPDHAEPAVRPPPKAVMQAMSPGCSLPSRSASFRAMVAWRR